MINLLPPDRYAQLRAARHNVVLLRLVISSLLCLLGVIAMVSLTYTLIRAQEAEAQQAIEENQVKLGKYTETEKESKDFKNNLHIAKEILDKNTSYRTMLINIAQVLPQDDVIQSLHLSAELIGQPTQLTIMTTSYDKAVQTKDILNNSDIAKDVSIESISNQDDGSEDTESNKVERPVVFQVNLTFTDKILKPTWNDSNPNDGGDS